MMRPSLLKQLQKRHYGLEALPESVAVLRPGTPKARVKLLEEASVDDIAFVLRAAEREFESVIDRMNALRRLHDLARRAGALGADLALPAALNNRGEP